MKLVGVVLFAVLTILVIVGTSVNLNIRYPILVSDPPEFEPIILKSFGGDGTAEVEAIIGDKILDLFLYQHVLARFKNVNVDILTTLRNSMVTNDRLAAIGRPFVVPHFMSPQDWKRSDVHERATSIECIIGRKYFTSDANLNPIPQFTPALVLFLNDVLIAIQKNMQTTRHLTTHILEPVYSVTNKKTVCVGEKDPVISLFRWLATQKVSPKSSISIDKVTYKFAGHMFVAKFKLRQPQLELQSPPQLSEKRARAYVCRMALQKLEIDTSIHLTLKLNHAPAEIPDKNVKNEWKQKKQANDISSADHQASQHDTGGKLENHMTSLQRKLKKDNTVSEADPIVPNASENNAPASLYHKRQLASILVASEANGALRELEDYRLSLRARHRLAPLQFTQRL